MNMIIQQIMVPKSQDSLSKQFVEIQVAAMEIGHNALCSKYLLNQYQVLLYKKKTKQCVTVELEA